ncbi:MAG: hydrogenase maturation nickel metallochaperone HypA [Desulfovibrio sp.]|nr:hydrogenase maturation nickel metallochaperone HypA [Desulfovibrio sp.]
MSLVASLLDIARQEMRSRSAAKILRLRVRYGALANIVPDAFLLAFEIMTRDQDLAGARLDLVEEPLLLACGGCGREFSPAPLPTALFASCPLCGEEIGHRILAGKGLFLDRLELA